MRSTRPAQVRWDCIKIVLMLSRPAGASTSPSGMTSWMIDREASLNSWGIATCCHMGRNSSLRFPVKVGLPSLKTAMGVDSSHSFRAFTRDCLVQMFFSLVMISRVGTFLPRELLLGCNRMLRLETNRRWSV